MRILSQEFDPERPDFREIQVAVSQESIPAPGNRIQLDNQVFVVEGVLRWYEGGIHLDYREIAFDLTVRREGAAGAGVTEPVPDPPPTLSAGAEALLPEDADESNSDAPAQ